MLDEKLYKLMDEKKVNYIGIDIDQKKDLVIAYINAKILFPDAKIDVFKSSSGNGFHIKIWKSVSFFDDLCIRCQLFDDAARIAISMRRFIQNPEDMYFDVLFDKKNGVNVIKYEVEDIIKEEDIEFIEKYSKEKNFDVIRERIMFLEAKIEKC